MKRTLLLLWFGLLVSLSNYTAWGQNNIEKDIRSLKAYRDTIEKRTCRVDTIKQVRCKEKTAQYLAFRKKFLLKLDSADKVIYELNEKGGKYCYYLLFGKETYFHWGDCNIGTVENGVREILDDEDWAVDRKIEIVKCDKFNYDLNGFTSGQTFYREDIK